jgi:hypothetical protein
MIPPQAKQRAPKGSPPGFALFSQKYRMMRYIRIVPSSISTEQFLQMIRNHLLYNH